MPYDKNSLNGRRKELYTCKDRVVKVRVEDPVEERTYIEELKIVGCGFTMLTCGKPLKCPRCHAVEIPKVEDKDEYKILVRKIAKGIREI
jgi:hypothetical protein